MHCGKRELAIWLKHFVYWGSQIWGSLKIVIFFGGQKKMYQIKKTPPLPSVPLLMKGL